MEVFAKYNVHRMIETCAAASIYTESTVSRFALSTMNVSLLFHMELSYSFARLFTHKLRAIVNDSNFI